MLTKESHTKRKVHTHSLYLVSTYSDIAIKQPSYLPTHVMPSKNDRAKLKVKLFESTIAKYRGN